MSGLQTEMEELEDEWMGWFWGRLASNRRKRKKRTAELKDRIIKVIEENDREREELKDCFLLCRVRAHIRTSLIATYQAMAVFVALTAAVLTVYMDVTKDNRLQFFMLFAFAVILIAGIILMKDEYIENRRAAFYRCAAELLEDRLKEDKGDVL